MEYVISIAKRYHHARTHYKDPRNRGIRGAKPILGIYVIDKEGRLRFRRISAWLVPYYRRKIWKRRILVCLECGRRFVGLIKKETDEVSCPHCSAFLD